MVAAAGGAKMQPLQSCGLGRCGPQPLVAAISSLQNGPQKNIRGLDQQSLRGCTILQTVELELQGL
tara:strand:- start:68 stop:265 length:198 start_codon:yes stop_codon:yes gene_type:complete